MAAVGSLWPSFASGQSTGAIKVGGIYTVPVTQQWIERIHVAALEYVVRGEINYVFAENVEAADYDQILRRFAESEIDLIIGDAFSHEEDARLIARDFPNKAFLMGSSFQPDSRFPNFSVFDSYIQDASYLTGIIGGSLTQRAKIGIVGRYDFPASNRLINAFIDGVHDFRPDIQISVEFIESWHDPGKAGELAFAQITNGADVIYSDAVGTAEAAHKSGTPVIGSFYSREISETEGITTSAQWHFNPTLQNALNRLRDGTFGAADFGVYSYMRHSGCSIAPISAYNERISESARELTAARELDMRNFRFTAKVNSSRPFSGIFTTQE